MAATMLKKLVSIFAGTRPLSARLDIDSRGVSVAEEVKVGLLAVLMEISTKDGQAVDEEIKVLTHVGEHYLGLSEQEAVDLIGQALTARKKAGSIDSFAKTLNEHYADEQKQLVLALGWKIVLADGEIDDLERKFATQVRYRLLLNAEQAEEAMEMAERDRL